MTKLGVGDFSAVTVGDFSIVITTSAAAVEYGIHGTIIRDIWNGRIWRRGRWE